MTNLKTRKSKTFHHPQRYLTKKLELRSQNEDLNVQAACLLKYFPKYYKNLDINLSSSRACFVISKLRQTKMIENLTLEGTDAKNLNKLEQSVFRNKRKLVKSLPSIQTSNEYTNSIYRPQISTFFPKITSLDLCLMSELNDIQMESTFIDRKLEPKIWRSYAYFWKGFQYLKHLEMANCNSHFWLIIRQVNSLPNLLSSLETLKLFLAFQCDPQSHSLVRDILGELNRNGSFLRRVTHLDCQDFGTLHYYDDLMGSVLAHCPKLVSLNFLIGREAQYYPDISEIYKEHGGLEVFKQLERMNSLKTLNVSAYGLKSFVKYFSVPKSVKKLVLYVGHSFYNLSFLDLFQDPENRFFERWNGLQNLQTLKLKMRMIEGPNDLFHKFINPLLEALPNCLKKLRLEITGSPAFYWKNCRAIDLSLLLENKSPALKQLESLKILADSLKMELEPNKALKFLNLKKLAIDGKIFDWFDFESCFQLLPEKTFKTFKLSTLTFESIQLFRNFIKLIKKEMRQGNLALNLKIRVFIKSFQEVFDQFKIPIDLKGANVNLEIILMSPAGSDIISRLSKSRKNEFERIFGSFDLSLNQRIADCYKRTKLI